MADSDLELPSGPGLDFVERAGPVSFFRPAASEILPGVESWLNQPFAMIPGFRPLRLDIHRPMASGGPAPVIVFAPGGAWLLAPKNHAPWRRLLEEGYAVVAIEYRLSSEARFPAQIHDIKAAIRWVRQNADAFGLDVERIAGWGCSAGGYLISLAAATNAEPAFEGTVGEALGESSALACAIAHYPATDLLALGEDTNDIPGIVEPMGTATSAETRLLGFIPSDRPEEAARAGVPAHVGPDTVPFLIMHGDADTRVGIGQSLRLHAALKAAGAPSEYHCIAGANHGDPRFETAEVTDVVARFLARAIGAPRQR